MDRLRRKRGDEQVTFGDVADHLQDFVTRDPGSAGTIDALASFLAEVEDVSHRHDGVGATLDPSTRVR